MLRGLVFTIGGWFAVGIVTALGGGGSADPLAPGFLLLCALLLLAPLGLAIPASRTLGAPGWAVEAIIAWAALGYLLCCVDPARLGRGWALVLLLPTLVSALASPTLLIAAYLPAARTHRLRAQGYVLSASLCGILLLRSLDAISATSLLVLGLFICIAQVFIMASPQRPATSEALSSSADALPDLAPRSQPPIAPARLATLIPTSSGD